MKSFICGILAGILIVGIPFARQDNLEKVRWTTIWPGQYLVEQMYDGNITLQRIVTNVGSSNVPENKFEPGKLILVGEDSAIIVGYPK